jgi:flagellar hook-associated protein 2
MDWKTTVDQLMQIEQVPQDTLKKKQALVTKTQSAYDTLKSNLTALKNAAFALQTGLTGFPRTASVTANVTSTTASDATATTSSGAAIGNYRVNVTSLGTASKLTGVAAAAKPTQAAASGMTLRQFGVTAGSVTINGTKYDIVDADLDHSLEMFFGLSGGGTTFGAGTPANFRASVAGPSDPAGLMEGTLKLEAGNLSAPSGPSGFSVGAPGDTSNFMAALGLSYNSNLSALPTPGTSHATYTQVMPPAALGTVALSGLVNGSNFATENLLINGVSVGSFGGNSTLGSVISAINSNPTTGVTASVDATTGKLVLTGSALGRTSISLSNPGGNLLTALGLGTGSSFVEGGGMKYDLYSNSSLVVSQASSDTSTVDLSQYGFGPTKVAVSNTGDFMVRVSSSGADYKTKISTLISAYNDLKQTLEDSTKITVGSDGKVSASVFSNRADINNLLSTIKSKIYSQVSDSTGGTINSSYNTAGKIGLGFDSAGKMQISDSTKLDAALANNPSFVDSLFNLNKNVTTSLAPENQGIATRIYNITNSMVSTGGLILTAKASLTTQNTRLQSQIDSMTRTLAQQRASLERSFIAMEQAQSRYQSMTSQLTNAFK